ncbi:MAG: hypothetical protein AB7E76_02800 [Deferribacterales bacterium]
MKIEVFRTGQHRDAGGQEYEATPEKLHQIANDYNVSDHDAPVVIGHPADNAPAYGWVKALSVAGDRLMAELRDIQPEFKDWVNRSLFKKRSISLYPSGLLRHVGFLGALPPAVKGLKDFEFKSGEGFEQYEYEDIQDQKEVDMTLEELQAQLKVMQDRLSVLETEKKQETERADKAEADLEKVNTEFSDAQAKQAKAELTQFVDQLVADEKLLGKDKANVLAFAEGLAAGGKVINFSDKEETPLAAFKALMSGMPKLTDLSHDFSDSNPGRQTEQTETIKNGQV